VIRIPCKTRILNKMSVADLVHFNQMIVELQGLDRPSGREEFRITQKATGLKAGLLIDFGSHPRLEWSRFVY
jgi:hypothetical protein